MWDSRSSASSFRRCWSGGGISRKLAPGGGAAFFAPTPRRGGAPLERRDHLRKAGAVGADDLLRHDPEAWELLLERTVIAGQDVLHDRRQRLGAPVLLLRLAGIERRDLPADLVDVQLALRAHLAQGALAAAAEVDAVAMEDPGGRGVVDDDLGNLGLWGDVHDLSPCSLERG